MESVSIGQPVKEKCPFFSSSVVDHVFGGAVDIYVQGTARKDKCCHTQKPPDQQLLSFFLIHFILFYCSR